MIILRNLVDFIEDAQEHTARGARGDFRHRPVGGSDPDRIGAGANAAAGAHPWG